MNYEFDFSPYNNIAIFPHQSPDGDAIGSAVAISLYLQELGKKAVIVIDDEIQYELRFLLEYTEFITYEEALIVYDDWDFCITVDCGDIERITRRRNLIKDRKLLNIDHHITNPGFGDFNIVDVKAPAACEIIYLILKANGFTPTKKIAEAIYTGISTDTGNFLYDNVRAKTFVVAAELIEIGIDKNKIVFELYQNNRSEKIKLHADVMSKMTIHCGGKLAVTYVDPAMLKKNSASMLDTEGVSESMRDIRGVEVACFLKEQVKEDNSIFTKVSMRSLAGHDVAKVASHFGGGGHKAAAGFTLNKNKEEVKELLLEQFNI